MDLLKQIEAHRVQLETKVEGFKDEQGIEIPVYLLMRTIKLIKSAEKSIEQK